MSPRSRNLFWVIIGSLVAGILGLTTDQIIQNSYDSVNTALRANVVAGSIPGGGPTPTPQPTATPLTFGTSGVITTFAASEFGSYAGSTCASGFATATSAAWALTCATPVPPTPLPTATPQPTATPRSPTYRSSDISGSANNVNNTNAHNYYVFGATGGASTISSDRAGPLPIAATAKNLACYISAAPASTTSWSFTLWTGTCGSTLSVSALTCTITGNGSLQTCTDSSHSVAISANQCAAMDVIGTNTPTAGIFNCGVEVDY